nr:MAG TPA_asm: hypothetical protein [Caudoviricetes sp.]
MIFNCLFYRFYRTYIRIKKFYFNFKRGVRYGV